MNNLEKIESAIETLFDEKFDFKGKYFQLMSGRYGITLTSKKEIEKGWKDPINGVTLIIEQPKELDDELFEYTIYFNLEA